LEIFAVAGPAAKIPAGCGPPPTGSMTDTSTLAEPTYTYRPSLLGAPWTFQLAPDALVWGVGRRSGRLRYGDIVRARLSFRPITIQQRRYMTEVWGRGAPKLTLVSSSWKSMVENERLDPAYTRFVTELHRRIAGANPAARFETGTPFLTYWLGLAVFVVVSFALAILTVRALAASLWGGAAFIVAFLGLFLWKGGDYFRRNRPRPYRPDRLPPDLMPRSGSG
jgi:hypothetical protein